jgi:hypothetical protein
VAGGTARAAGGTDAAGEERVGGRAGADGAGFGGLGGLGGDGGLGDGGFGEGGFGVGGLGIGGAPRRQLPTSARTRTAFSTPTSTHSG